MAHQMIDHIDSKQKRGYLFTSVPDADNDAVWITQHNTNNGRDPVVNYEENLKAERNTKPSCYNMRRVQQ